MEYCWTRTMKCWGYSCLREVVGYSRTKKCWVKALSKERWVTVGQKCVGLLHFQKCQIMRYREKKCRVTGLWEKKVSVCSTIGRRCVGLQRYRTIKYRFTAFSDKESNIWFILIEHKRVNPYFTGRGSPLSSNSKYKNTSVLLK